MIPMDNTKPYTKAPKPEIGRGCTFYYAPEGVAAKPCEGCYKLHETAWLEQYPQHTPTDIFEVRFKNTRRSYYQNVNNLPLERGDIVAVEASPGHDIGIVSLTGDMVARQMRRVGFNPYNGEFKKIYRKAKPYDIERWQEAIALEHETMITARQIAAEMGLNMKIGDVEYQGDKIKAIFYYIADERVDFRELIKVFAERFHIRIEMKQIGARQEAGRIGGIGACGRELCCATWMTNFVSVSTSAARYQDISLNPQKLAGQCAKLKCCLNYEVDAYVEAQKRLPSKEITLETIDGTFYFFKADILKGTITYSTDKNFMANIVTIPARRAFEIINMNRRGEKPESLLEAAKKNEPQQPVDLVEQESLTRFDKRKGNNNNRKKKRKGESNGNNEGAATNSNKPQQPRDSQPKGEGRPPKAENRPPKGENRPPKAENRPPKGEGRPPRGEGRPPRENKENRPEGRRNREDGRERNRNNRRPGNGENTTPTNNKNGYSIQIKKK